MSQEALGRNRPRHEQVADDLSRRVGEGEWSIGANLPSETTLARHYSVSRHTLRHALGTLEQWGLILRRQGSPARVISKKTPRVLSRSFHSPADMLRYPSNTFRVNLVQEYLQADAGLSRMLGAPIDSAWYHIGAVRKEERSGASLAYSDIYILPQFAGLVNEPDHSHSMVYEQIERKYGVAIDRAELEVCAVKLPNELADALQAPAGAPCLMIVRRYFDPEGQPFEITVTHHPESRFTYTAEYRSIRRPPTQPGDVHRARH
ncbi:MAG: GntR family transcriptional regulator [Betaproteobacteria bacterium]|nr:GntR family transcriptional regulator [Betaproteobacteria bacterium]NBT74617.1 GntR family transcriptional regulator [Betaproteobacteria bacterium]NBY13917.1 GntR family transcriptional regulator [Betaproteobacteria bacterium]